MSVARDFPKRVFRSRRELRDWLAANHDTADTFWLVSYKKHVKGRHVPYGDIVEELLCFGWINTRTRRLEKAGLMTPAGRDKIDAAKRDGSWTFLDDVENLEIPSDLENALAKNKTAKRNFDAFNASAKKIILLWIKTAKRSDTRTKRVGETVRLAAKGLKAAHPEARGQ